MTKLCKDLNTLKLADLYKLEIVKYLYPLQNNKLSKSLHDDYFKINEMHNYDMRQIQNKVYFKPRINKSIGKERLVYGGFELWKNITEFLKLLN